ncbi:hypothetical protein F4776DRAFT_668074 [Hypoxylon sp. NC0597]|nr:hypothetical protein F4776DRAFT_668074 [Hypoxylon sp. NC0597]
MARSPRYIVLQCPFIPDNLEVLSESFNDRAIAPFLNSTSSSTNLATGITIRIGTGIASLPKSTNSTLTIKKTLSVNSTIFISDRSSTISVSNSTINQNVVPSPNSPISSTRSLSASAYSSSTNITHGLPISLTPGSSTNSPTSSSTRSTTSSTTTGSNTGSPINSNADSITNTQSSSKSLPTIIIPRKIMGSPP